jgi:hypothetical protein
MASMLEAARIGQRMPRLTNTPDIKIDSVHSRAICDEVGYRLRQSLQNSPPEHPRHRALLDRLRQNELGQQGSGGAPSIVPSLDDIEARPGIFRTIFGTSTPLRRRGD